MALEVVYRGLINRENDTVTIEDITGEDNLVNSTKYSNGINNPNKPTSSSILTLLVITKPDGTQQTIQLNNSITSVTPTISASTKNLVPANTLEVELDSSDLGLPNVQFDTGVYIVEVFVFTEVNLGGIVPPLTSLSTNRIVGSSTAFDSITDGFGDTDIIYIISQADSSKRQLNYIEEIIDSENIILSESLSSVFTNGIPVTIFAGYKTTTYVKADKDLLDCYLPKIAKISVEEKKCCSTCGGETISNLTDILMGIFDIEAQLSIGMYEEANKNVISLTKECKNIECSTC